MEKLSSLEFIMLAESGELTQEQFDANAQAFVDSGVWRSLQGSWQRMVMQWVNDGLVAL